MFPMELMLFLFVSGIQGCAGTSNSSTICQRLTEEKTEN